MSLSCTTPQVISWKPQTSGVDMRGVGRRKAFCQFGSQLGVSRHISLTTTTSLPTAIIRSELHAITTLRFCPFDCFNSHPIRLFGTSPSVESPEKMSHVFLIKRKFEKVSISFVFFPSNICMQDPNAVFKEPVREKMVWSVEGIKAKLRAIGNHYWVGTKKLYRNIQFTIELKQRYKSFCNRRVSNN